MVIRKAFRCKLKVNSEIEEKLLQYSGNCRWLWNKALAMNLARLEKKQKLLWYRELDWFVKLWKQSDEYSYLKLSPSQTLQQTLKNLERAFKDGFDRKQPTKRIPTFKKKGVEDSFRFPQGFKVENRRLFLPKIGWVGIFKSQKIEGAAKNITVSREGKDWYASIQVEFEKASYPHLSKSKIGIDMGVKKLCTLSTGKYYEPIKISSIRLKIASLQRRLAKRVKFSNNWHKLKDRISKLYTKIARIRRDYLHKITSNISKNHAMIVLEDLQIKNMTKSAKGDVEEPGCRVSQKSGLNRVILEQGWGMFKEFLEYKQSWSSGQIIYVNPKNTSITCPKCGHIDKLNRPSQAKFSCDMPEVWSHRQA